MKLLVEDELKVASFIEGALKGAGSSVIVAYSLPEATEAILSHKEALEVVVLDRMLKGRDGLELLPLIKASAPRARVLVLSAICDPMEKARAIDRGADDYLAKPFSLEELLARIRSLQRRAGEVSLSAPTTITVRDLECDLLAHRVRRAGKAIDLSQKEYQLLVLFLQHPGRVYNRFQLLDQVWSLQFEVSSNVVESTIKNVRRKLEEAGSSVEIQSRRNVGYWVEA